MMLFRFLIAIVVLVGLTGSTTAQRFGAMRINSAPVTSKLSLSEIFEGQSVTCTVYVQNLGNAKPRAEGFDDFKVDRYAGNGSRTVISGGRRWSIIEHQFQLTPKKTGELIVPPFVVEHQGKTYTSKTLQLTVKTADQQDTIRLEQSVSRETIYPAQGFEVAVTVQVKALENELRLNPLEVNAQFRQLNAPHLMVPWLSDRDLPAGLVPEQERDVILVPLNNRVGFRINDISSRPAFLDIIDRTYSPQPQKIAAEDADGESAIYWQFTFRRKLIGTLPGTYTLDPCIGQGEFAKRPSRRDPGIHSVYARSNPVTITVLPVPTEGRPDDYINASGQIAAFTSEIRPSKASVGDPLTLTLRLSGSGAIHEATAPDLSKVPEVSRNFRLLDPTTELINGVRVFTYSLRPLNTTIAEIPPIEASYFDVVSERYLPISTESIPLEVSEARPLNTSQIVSQNPSDSNAIDEIELSQDGLFGNATDIDSFTNDRLRPIQWFLGWGGTLGAYALAWGLMSRRISADANPLRASRRSALATAKSQLMSAKSCLSKSDDKGTTDAIRESFVGLIADVTGKPTAGMTPQEVSAKLVELDLPIELADQVRDLLEQCEASRYGASQVGPQEIETAERLLRSIASAMEQRGLLS